MTRLPSPQTVAEIARLVGGQAVGDESVVIEAISDLASAGPTDLSFLENPKYAAAAAAAPAGCLLVPPQAKETPCAAKTKILVDEPRGAFAVLLGVIDKARRGKTIPTFSSKASIHATAKFGPGVAVGDFTVIEKGAVVGEGTVISPQCYVGENARIGKNCLLYPQVVLRDDCRIGDRVIVHPGTVIGADGFGFTTDKKTGRHTKVPQVGNVVIGDDVEIGANVTIDRASLGSTVVESGVQVDNLVQIAHNVRVGRDSVIVAQVGIAGSTKIGDGVVLGGQVGVAGHISICDRTQVGAQSGIMSTIEPDAAGKAPILFGTPARTHREAFKLQAFFGRLPELFDRVKALEKRTP